MITHNEPIARLFTQGMCQKGGVAMSKSREMWSARDMAQNMGRTPGDSIHFLRHLPKGFGVERESIEGSWRFLNRV